MAAHIAQIGKHKFICGLFWQSLSRPRDFRKEAAELARKIDADMVVVRADHAVAQAGYAHTKDGARRGLFSLAMVVAKTLGTEGVFYDGRVQPVHNWLAAFKLPDGMWFCCAARDANFLPNGDFSGTKEAVIERLYGDYGLGGWNAVIGDPELEALGFHNFSAKTIEHFLPVSRGGKIAVANAFALRPVEQKVSWKIVGAAGLAIAVAGATGYSIWKKYQVRQDEMRRAVAFEAARKALVTAMAHPWATKPLPAAMARACTDKLSFMTPGGWQLDEYVCTARSVSYTWSRANSVVNYLLEQVPGANIDADGEKARYAESVSLVPGTDEKLLGAAAALQAIQSGCQALGIAPSITAAQQAGGVTAQRERPAESWKVFTLALRGDGLAPSDLAAVLGKPGVRLEKLTYRAGVWSAEGVLYAN